MNRLEKVVGKFVYEVWNHNNVWNLCLVNTYANEDDTYFIAESDTFEKAEIAFNKMVAVHEEILK